MTVLLDDQVYAWTKPQHRVLASKFLKEVGSHTLISDKVRDVTAQYDDDHDDNSVLQCINLINLVT